MAQVWVRTNRGDMMRLGDAQKARKADKGLAYEIVADGDSRGRQAAGAGNARLHAGGGEIKSPAIVADVEPGRKPTGGEHSDEVVGGVGQKARRPVGRPRRNG